MTTSKLWQRAWLAAAATVASGLGTASAQTPATPAPAATTETEKPAVAPAADAPPPGFWIDGIHLSAQIEGGITGNFDGPKQNFGQLFTDKPNTVLLNQLLLTANKPLDPKATGFDWGFKLQGMYGSDARYTHFLGEFDWVNPTDRNQFDIVEANALFHLPVLFDGGVDLKVGQYSTPLGFETIDPSTNPFYSHSYIFNFGLPLKHTGFLTTSHVNSMLDVYLGLDTGANTSFGSSGEDNSAIAFLGGVNLTLMGGNLTVLALTHVGPENSTRLLSSPLLAATATTYNADGYFRYYNDIVVTYKATTALTLTTEFNWIRDDFGTGLTTGKPAPANAFGVAQYASYTLSDTLTLNGRAEVYRDDNNFFVSGFASNDGFDLAQKGLSTVLVSGAKHATTYGELTLGVTYKPSGLPPIISGLMIRPEIRWDTDLGGASAFNGGTANSSFTAASDVVLTF
jgi:Putative beta-barrel porin-2, OmpL-like. bbp2